MRTPKSRQRGLGLIQVAIVMAVMAAIAMAALMSMRAEHNYFTDIANKLLGKPSAPVGADSGSPAVAAAAVVPPPPAGVLRKCTVNGKNVYSDVDCKSGQAIKAIDTQGIEAPKVPKPDPASSAPQSATDKMIDKATQ
jgi:hypothetical protein